MRVDRRDNKHTWRTHSESRIPEAWVDVRNDRQRTCRIYSPRSCTQWTQTNSPANALKNVHQFAGHFLFILFEILSLRVQPTLRSLGDYLYLKIRTSLWKSPFCFLYCSLQTKKMFLPFASIKHSTEKTNLLKSMSILCDGKLLRSA